MFWCITSQQCEVARWRDCTAVIFVSPRRNRPIFGLKGTHDARTGRHWVTGEFGFFFGCHNKALASNIKMQRWALTLTQLQLILHLSQLCVRPRTVFHRTASVCQEVLAIKCLPESHLCDFAATESGVSDTSSFLLWTCSVLNCWISRNVNICKVTAELVQLIIFVKNSFRSRLSSYQLSDTLHVSLTALKPDPEYILSSQDLSITFIGLVSECFEIALERSNVSALSSGNICRYEKQKKQQQTHARRLSESLHLPFEETCLYLWCYLYIDVTQRLYFWMILFEGPKQVSYIMSFNVNRQTPLISRPEVKILISFTEVLGTADSLTFMLFDS